MLAEICRLPEAVAELVDDGDTVTLEGLTHLIPATAGQDIIRQGGTGKGRYSDLDEDSCVVHRSSTRPSFHTASDTSQVTRNSPTTR